MVNFIFALVLRASHPRLAILGRAPSSLQFNDIHRHPENKTVPGLLIVRPENGLFFANAAGIREAILVELQSATVPVKAVLLDLGATTDLDVPSADMLDMLHEDLSSRNVRFMLMHIIMPVRRMLELAGVMEKINLQDIFIGPVRAVLDYLSSQSDDAAIQELLRSEEILYVVCCVRASRTTPLDRQALGEISESLDKEMKNNELKEE